MNTLGLQLVDDYFRWLRSHTQVRDVEGWTEITVPFLDRHNDHLQLYVQPHNGDYVLTDDGYTVADLEMSGCRLTSTKRRELLDTTLNGFGVKLEDGALVTKTTSTEAPKKAHNLIQAMMAVNDLFYLAEPTVASFFVEDVGQWLQSEGVRFTPDVKFTGKSGFDYRFDFVVPASAEHPERIVRAINHPTNELARASAFAWIDTRQTRSEQSVAYAFLNDAEQAVSSTVAEALSAYDVKPIPWSRRADVRDELAA